MAEKCLICDGSVDSDRCVIRGKGLQGLYNASISRKDGKQNRFSGKKSAIVHASCRKIYTRAESIAADLKRDPSECQQSTSRGSLSP